MNPKVVAREWLWFAACIGTVGVVAVIFLLTGSHFDPDRSATWGFVRTVAALYAVVTVIRSSAWALREMRSKD